MFVFVVILNSTLLILGRIANEQDARTKKFTQNFRLDVLVVAQRIQAKVLGSFK